MLIGVENDGTSCFWPHIYQGSISNVGIVKASGPFTELERDSVVSADRGFKLVEFAKNYGVNWIVPPSVFSGKSVTDDELKETYKIARVRIVVERSTRRLKKWAQLNGPLLISDFARLDVGIRVILHLSKSLPPLSRKNPVEIISLEQSLYNDNQSSATTEQDLEDAHLLLGFASESLLMSDLLTVELGPGFCLSKNDTL